MESENKPQTKLLNLLYDVRFRYLTPGIVIPALIIGALTVFLLFELIIPAVRDRTAFYGAPAGYVSRDPAKTPSKTPPFAFKGTYGLYTTKHDYLITPIMNYEIEARVLHKRRYYSDANTADLIPYDVGLGWGIMSDATALRNYFVFHHNNTWGRYLRIDLKTDWQNIPQVYLDEMQAGRYFSNNHVIPADGKVFQALKDVDAGDIVRLKGYLVNVTRPGSPAWQWKTSQYAREDEKKYNKWGNGMTPDHMTTCDTIFITTAEILPPLSLPP